MTQLARRKLLQGAGILAASMAAANKVMAKVSPGGTPGQCENPCPEKPKPIITGTSQAEGIAKFAGRMTYGDLTPERASDLSSASWIR